MPKNRHRGGKHQYRMGKKAPEITYDWGPVTFYDADGNITDMQPAIQPPKPKRKRRRS